MSDLLSVIALVGGLSALIALMPDFEGPERSGWDLQDGDE